MTTTTATTFLTAFAVFLTLFLIAFGDSHRLAMLALVAAMCAGGFTILARIILDVGCALFKPTMKAPQ